MLYRFSLQVEKTNVLVGSRCFHFIYSRVYPTLNVGLQNHLLSILFSLDNNTTSRPLVLRWMKESLDAYYMYMPQTKVWEQMPMVVTWHLTDMSYKAHSRWMASDAIIQWSRMGEDKWNARSSIRLVLWKCLALPHCCVAVQSLLFRYHHYFQNTFRSLFEIDFFSIHIRVGQLTKKN